MSKIRGEASSISKGVEFLDEESIVFAPSAVPEPICADQSISTSSADCNKSKRKVNLLDPENDDETVATKKLKGIIDVVVEETKVPARTRTSHRLFTVDLVMLRILRYLPNVELLLCRNIDRMCKHFTDHIIQKRQLSCTFHYKWDSHNYSLTSKALKDDNGDDVSIKYTLSALTEVTKNSPCFPVTHFSFDRGTLQSPDLQEFLSNYGENIKGLKIQVFCPPKNTELIPPSPISTSPTINFLKNLLVTQVPKLQILWLANCPSQWTSSKNLNRLFPELDHKEKQITLPNLRRLHLPNKFFTADHILADLLQAACNLYVLYSNWIDQENAVPLLKLNKFHLLKQCVFKPAPKDMELYETVLPTSTCRLVNLTLFVSNKFFYVPELIPRVSKIITLILTANSATLKQIIWFAQIGFLPNFTIPVLPKLLLIKVCVKNFEELEIHQWRKKQFPPKFQFSTSFSNLKTVWLSVLQQKGYYEWEDYFDNCNPVLTVKNLGLVDRKLPKGWFQKIANLFPNIEGLWVKTMHFNAIKAGRSGLWGFAQLKNLTLRINIFDQFNTAPSLESAFTGFSSDTCNQLLTSSHNFDISTIGDVREYPSIVNLKNLESMRLEFVDTSQELKSQYPELLTKVTGLYAFRMCPNLNVTVTGTLCNEENGEALRNSLRILDDYVDVDFPFRAIKK